MMTSLSTTLPIGNQAQILEERRKREEATYNPPSAWAPVIKHYHGSQELFNKLSLETVEKLTKQFQEAIQNNVDFDVFFPKCCDFLIRERRKVAVKQGHKEPFLFRWMNDKNASRVLLTWMSDQYQDYGNRINAAIRKKLSQLVKEKGADISKGNYSGIWGKGDSRYFLKVINPAEFKALCVKFYAKAPQVDPYLEPICSYKGGGETIDVVHPSFPLAVDDLSIAYPVTMGVKPDLRTPMILSQKTSIIVGATVQKINSKWITLSLQMTWIYQKDPSRIAQADIDYMGETCFHNTQRDGKLLFGTNSQVVIVHADKDNIPVVLLDIGRLAKRALQWDKKDPVEFLNTIAEGQFKLNQLTPWERGGGNVPENIAKSLFKYHGFELVPNAKDVNIFFESHTYPMAHTFMAQYPKFYAVDPLSRPIDGAPAPKEKREEKSDKVIEG